MVTFANTVARVRDVRLDKALDWFIVDEVKPGR